MNETIASNTSSFNLLNTRLTSYDSDIASFNTTVVKIYNDIQSNRDRIIVLEGQINDTIQTIIDANAEINRNYDSDIALLRYELLLAEATHVSLYNDLSDLRNTLDKVAKITGVDSDFEFSNVDSECVWCSHAYNFCVNGKYAITIDKY